MWDVLPTHEPCVLLIKDPVKSNTLCVKIASRSLLLPVVLINVSFLFDIILSTSNLFKLYD